MVNKDNKIDVPKDKKILVVDDINDTGATLASIESVLTDYTNTIKYAVLVDNTASPFEVNYFGYEINKVEDPSWIIFPWECYSGSLF